MHQLALFSIAAAPVRRNRLSHRPQASRVIAGRQAFCCGSRYEFAPSGLPWAACFTCHNALAYGEAPKRVFRAA